MAWPHKVQRQFGRRRGIDARSDGFPYVVCVWTGVIDVVVVNLYPFYSTVTASSDGPVDFEKGVENIDIGGPAMLRAAAKVRYGPSSLSTVIMFFAHFCLLKYSGNPSVYLLQFCRV